MFEKKSFLRSPCPGSLLLRGAKSCSCRESGSGPPVHSPSLFYTPLPLLFIWGWLFNFTEKEELSFQLQLSLWVGAKQLLYLALLYSFPGHYLLHSKKHFWKPWHTSVSVWENKRSYPSLGDKSLREKYGTTNSTLLNNHRMETWKTAAIKLKLYWC